MISTGFIAMETGCRVRCGAFARNPGLGRRVTGYIVVGTFASLACAESPPPTCGELTSLEMSPVPIEGPGAPAYDVRVVSAEIVEADSLSPAHCKVAGLIGAEINFELLLPAEWNGKFLMGGGGGFVGSVQNQAQEGLSAGPTPLQRGYATAGTDTGHSGSGIQAEWALNNEERELNFGHRAVHLTADVAKSIIRTFYGDEIDYSYFFGCSRGGGQGMMESQRHPEDFDGIIAAAPAFNWTGIGAGMVRNTQLLYPDADLSAPIVTAANRALLESALLEACDSVDGVDDGVVEDPRRCDFDPADLPRCRGNIPNSNCVTAEQLGAIETVYGGPIVNGARLFQGFPFGGENDRGGWDQWITGGENQFGPGVPSLHYAFGTEMFKYLLFDDPAWDYSAYDFAGFDEESRRAASFLNATDTDLSAFKSRGGKLLMWHGWSDPALTALATVDYYEEAHERDPELTEYFRRLFMLPGVLHCGAGPGPDRVDWLSAIEGWVEEGQAPEQLVATKLGEGGSVERTRPICQYPATAAYEGSGSTDEASSFVCATP